MPFPERVCHGWRRPPITKKTVAVAKPLASISRILLDMRFLPLVGEMESKVVILQKALIRKGDSRRNVSLSVDGFALRKGLRVTPSTWRTLKRLTNLLRRGELLSQMLKDLTPTLTFRQPFNLLQLRTELGKEKRPPEWF